MQTLKDIKDVLKEIPDEVLEGCQFGLGEGCEEEISLVAWETGTISKDQIGFPEIFDKYPKLNQIHNLIRNIIKAQNILNMQGEASEELSEHLFEEGLTDTYFKKSKK